MLDRQVPGYAQKLATNVNASNQEFKFSHLGLLTFQTNA